MRLRDYQTRSLEALEFYLDEAATVGAKRAFVLQTDRPYRSVPQLPDLPYVCLRVPTGGGKTIMAAHAVGVVARHWLQRDRLVCLWLVPSNAVREQTLKRLRTIGDPYRAALESRFDGPVTVMDLAEALYVQRGTLDGETVVIVATLAALRVTDTEGRKIYEPSGALEHHFTGVAPVLLATLERRADGTAIESLANVLHLRYPVVIMDEAHNARTELSFETLGRFAPSCVVEFTATPQTRHAPEAGYVASNVLAHVSAAELKAEEMIKLPVKLWTQAAWTDAVTGALAKQRELETIAAREQQATGERIRPIVLFQAQPNRTTGESITPERLKQSLIDDHRVPADQIAIETGSTHELDGVDLSAADCPIRFIITVQALREGWDCPSAYVLCGIAEQASPRAVEQLLGRVLRLPEARQKREPELNEAYAYVVSPNFASAAQGLRDALVQAGFERLETNTLIEEGGNEHPTLFYATPMSPVQSVVSGPPRGDWQAELDPSLRDAIRFDDGSMMLSVSAPVSEAAAERLAECFTAPIDKATVRTLARESRQGPAARATPAAPKHRLLVIPQLAVRTQHGLELFEETHFLQAPWRLADRNSDLTDGEFPLRARGGQEGELDVGNQGRIQINYHEVVANQLTLLEGEPGWTTASLATWLDVHIPHPDLSQSDARLFIHRAIESLLIRTDATIDQLARDKYRLRKALELKISGYRSTQHELAFQESLFGASARVEVVPEIAVTMGDESQYSPNWLYDGPYQFRRHLYPLVGELKPAGEEYDCAIYLDEHPLVTCWMRNISNRPQTSFWLQTATDRFYPDFVGQLADGRVFAVEYKGRDRWSDDDSKEKRSVGELWSAASRGSCVFAMPQGPDWNALDAKFQTVST